MKVKSLSRVRLFATPWTVQSLEFSSQNTGVGSLSLLQGIFPTQGSSPDLLNCILTDPSAASSARQVKRRRVGQGGNKAGNPRVYKEEKKKERRPLSGSTVVPAATSWTGEEQEAGGGGRRGGGRKTLQLAPLGLRAPASPQQAALQVLSTQGSHASWKLLCL